MQSGTALKQACGTATAQPPQSARLGAHPCIGVGAHPRRHHLRAPSLRLAAVDGQDAGAPQGQQGPPSPAPPPPSLPPSSGTSSGAGIAAGAVLAAVAAFAAGRILSTGGPSLATLENMAVPLDVALANGKPTVMEFYANWCEVCQDLVEDEYAVEKQYGDSVNFVMLNIENSKWGPEVADYKVDGIPKFVFLDGKGNPVAAAVGRLPRQVLEGNVAALAQGQSKLPFSAIRERTSSMTAPDTRSSPKGAVAPRAHA